MCSTSRTWPVFMPLDMSLHSAGEESLLELFFDTLGGRSSLSSSSLVLPTLLSSISSSSSPPVLGVWSALLGVALAVPFLFPFCRVVRVETRLPTTLVVGFTTPCCLRGVDLDVLLRLGDFFDASGGGSGCPVTRHELRHFLIKNS